ncbi:alpha/beta hydrolase [Phenylobacterium sp.]|uniref:alpha/beta hydrolase family protein n=1 Tax=Phenylobacterium sp. TaxID=1871053 RepID=UPI0025E87F3E|nr:alpha/beta hydrolase [Phenylobacterium sp.]
MLKAVLILAMMMGPTMAAAEPASIDAYMSQPRHLADDVVHYGPAPSQVAELFLPKTRDPHPVVILLHGGCFLKQYEGFAQTSAIAADLAGHGYAVWNVEYRKLGEAGAGYPGTFQDVATAIDRLREEAPKHDLDLSRVIAIGHSAGGHLALWAAARSRIPATSPLHAAHPLKIGAVISLAGIGDLKGQGPVFALPCGDDTIARLVDSAHRAAPFADTSPAELLPSGAKVVMVHGVFDPVMPPYTGRDYAAKVRAAGGRAEVETIPGAAHFDLVIPTTAAWSAIVDVLDREMAALAHGS